MGSSRKENAKSYDPHIVESTLPVALAKLRPHLHGIDNFTIHDFRRTARTHLASLGVDPIVAERCLNHRIKGVEGIYNRHQYFDERKKHYYYGKIN